MSDKTNNDEEMKLTQPNCVNSQDLFGKQTRVRIKHQGIEYLLQITRQGKLILTK